MIFKLILCGVIIAGFGYMGHLTGEKQKDRLRQLDSFSDGLTMLEFNIKYMNYPIAKALENASENCDGVVKKIFYETGKHLQKDYGSNPGAVFDKKIEENKNLLCLSSDEIGILKSFSKTLSEGDVDTEIKNIEALKTRLDSAKSDATEEVNKKAKATKSISLLAGVFVVILLL